MEFKKKPKHSIKRPIAREPLHRDDNATRSVANPVAATATKDVRRGAPSGLITRTKLAIATRTQSLSRTKKTLLIGGVVAMVAVILYLVSAAVHNHKTAAEARADGVSIQTVKNLERQATLPKNLSIDALGGWQQTKTPTNEPIFTYADTVAGVPISVSQQLLPGGTKTSAQSQVADIAKKINATDKIDADGMAVYIGTSTKGPQYAVLTKNNVLIIIKSQNKIDTNAWSSYITSLK